MGNATPSPGKGQFVTDPNAVTSNIGPGSGLTQGQSVGIFGPADPDLDIGLRIYIDRDMLNKDLRKTAISVFRDYAKGFHFVVLTRRQQQILRSLLGNRFCDNVCHEIVADGANRLDFQRFEAPEDKAVDEFCANFYETARVQERQ